MLLNLNDYEAAAVAKLPTAHSAWIGDGAADGQTLRSNVDAWSSSKLALMPRGAVNVSRVDLSTSVLGKNVEWPVLVAPTSYQKLAHPEGELASARAAACTGTIFVASHAMSYTSEEVATAAGAAATASSRGEAGGSAVPPPRLWQQLYFLSSREKTLAFVRRVEAAGFEALVVTVDAAVGGLREGGLRAGFAFPADVTWANLGVSPADWAASAGQVSATLGWEDVAWLCAETRLPVLVKGVMCGADAVAAQRCGAAAVIVSNHGGRQLDCAPPTAEALACVCDALRAAAAARTDGSARKCQVLVDGGIRRGADVVKALALGATAVLVGRPVVWGLACGGEDGAAAVLRLLRRELTVTMALCGCTTVADIKPGCFASAHRSRSRL